MSNQLKKIDSLMEEIDGLHDLSFDIRYGSEGYDVRQSSIINHQGVAAH